MKHKKDTNLILKELKNIFVECDASEELTLAFLKLIEDKVCDINVDQCLHREYECDDCGHKDINCFYEVDIESDVYFDLGEPDRCNTCFNIWKNSKDAEEYVKLVDNREDREYCAVKEWVKESVSSANVDDWQWNGNERVLTIYNGDDTEEYSWQELIDTGLVVECISESDKSEEEISVPSTSEDDEEIQVNVDESTDDVEVSKKVPRRQLSTPARRQGEYKEDAVLCNTNDTYQVLADGSKVIKSCDGKIFDKDSFEYLGMWNDCDNTVSDVDIEVTRRQLLNPAGKVPRRQLSTPARRKEEPITETMEEAYHDFFCDNSLEFKVSCMVNPKLMDFIKDGSGIIESDYFVCPDCDPIPSGLECKCGGSFPTFPSNVSDKDWIEAFIERCQEDNGEALQNEIQEQEDLEIISFLQKCEDLMFDNSLELKKEPRRQLSTPARRKEEPITETMEKSLKIYNILHEIESLTATVGIKPYSHNLIAINLNILDKLVGHQETLRYMKLLKLDKLGWSCYES